MSCYLQKIRTIQKDCSNIINGVYFTSSIRIIDDHTCLEKDFQRTNFIQRKRHSEPRRTNNLFQKEPSYTQQYSTPSPSFVCLETISSLT